VPASAGRSHRWIAVPLALLGFLVVVAVSTTRVQRRNAEPRRTRLVKLIEDRRGTVDDLDGEVRTLRRRVDAATASVSRTNASERQRAEVVRQLGLSAGTTALDGPGLAVEIADSARRPATAEEASAFRIHDTDIQLIANALFAAGAEAVSINGSRLVTTSPIRAAGSTIVVNFRPLNAPYEVLAIGANEQDFQSSEIARRFTRWRGLFGLGFQVERRTRVVVPAFTGRVGAGAATPAPGPPGGPG
jgi:uncharacterized protein YlxW (UPF0749 family)